MAITEIYVDPSIAADSGLGTLVSPYGDLEYAIEQETFDTTNGTRINIKAGTDEILAAALQTALADTSVSIAWVPTEAAPLVFQGYTSAAGDGGIGGISGGGSVGVMTDAVLDYVNFIDLHLHNCGAANVLDLDNYCSVIRCEVDNTTGSGISVDSLCLVSQCYVHNTNGSAIAIVTGMANYNRVENGTNKFSTAISSSNAFVERNIIKIDGSTSGILLIADTGGINHNSVWSDGGTGFGIRLNPSTITISVMNNLVEGFSGTSGLGYDMDGAAVGIKVYGGNSAYNNETNYTAPSNHVVQQLGGASSNETLTASPFKDAANGDFSPVDTGSVREGALPQVFGGGFS